MVNSDLVATGLIVAYTIYSLVAISLFGWFAYRITKPTKKPVIKPVLFYSFTTLLIIIGVSLHLTTMHTIPWVKLEMDASKINPDRLIKMEVDSFKFYLLTDSIPQELPTAEPIKVKEGETVMFDVYSKDLTYGFGLFRPNNTMVLQMQVLPLYSNKIIWKFTEKGTFTLRSTEYAGPKSTQMIIPNFITVE